MHYIHNLSIDKLFILVNIDHNDLTNEGAKYVQNLLLNNQNIEYLNIGNILYVNIIRIIYIHLLSIGENKNIKEEGIRDICSALEMNKRITKLHMRNSRLYNYLYNRLVQGWRRMCRKYSEANQEE